MLSSLFISQTVKAVSEALASAGIGSGSVTVLDQPRLGRALAESGFGVIQIANKAKSLKRVSGDRLCGMLDTLPLADAHLAAVIAPGIGLRDDWDAVMAEWSRVVRDGGAIVLIDRAPAAELTRRALCSGLAEIEQRQVGRTIVTSGLVRKLD